MTTQTMLGALLTESTPVYDQDRGNDRPSGTMDRPTGVVLRNDGIFRHWLARGNAYRLEHDGTGWRVHNDLFAGHVYRLADTQDAQFVDRLPLNGGDLLLERGAIYTIRETEPMGPWDVYAS